MISPPLAALAAFLVTWLLLEAMLRTGIAHRLAIDEPNHRSLHEVPTPRVGGLALMPAALAAWLAATSQLWPLAALAAVLSLLSYADDRHDLPVALRFGTHLAAAAIAVWLLLPEEPAWALMLSVLAIGWLTNLYNFMDGADGLAGGMAVAGFSAYAAAAWLAGDHALAAAATVVAAAAAGFLIVNFPPAQVFMGDAGSIPLGFLAGSLGLAGVARGAWPWWLPLLAFSPFIVDATITLLRRALRGERVWHAHREHAYQKLVRAGWSHRRLLVTVGPLMAAGAAAAVALRDAPAIVPLVGATVIYGVLLALVERRWRAHIASQSAPTPSHGALQ